jgi:hypothetical protein
LLKFESNLVCAPYHHGKMIATLYRHCRSLFTLKHGNDFLLVQIYVDDIIFGGSSYMLVSGFQKIMEEFQMSMMGELIFFRYPSQANEARYFRISSQVHEGPVEEVQHG